jgi:hypothetical protein
LVFLQQDGDDRKGTAGKCDVIIKRFAFHISHYTIVPFDLCVYDSIENPHLVWVIPIGMSILPFIVFSDTFVCPKDK